MIDTFSNNGHNKPSAKHRTQINRANAAHSTGPRTTEGKQRASLNALRHGLTGHTIVLPTEDLAAYQRHSQRWLRQFEPKGAVQEQLVQTLSDTAWRLNRIPALETNLLTLGITEQEDGIETAETQANTALAMAAALREDTRALAIISLHEQRLSRQFERTLQQLRELQADDREKEEIQMDRAADMLKMHQEQGLPYTPADDGFVFSIPEIETGIRLRTRRRQAVDSAWKRNYGSPAAPVAPSSHR